MDIRKLETLDDAIKIDEIEYHEPYPQVFIGASISLELSELFSIESWDTLTEEAKKTHKEQLKDYLKHCILKLISKELKTRGLSCFEIRGKPIKYAHVSNQTYLAVLSEEQLTYLKERYNSVLRDIR